MTPWLLVISIIYAGLFIILIWTIKRAPYGWEDERGFHYGFLDDKQARAALQKLQPAKTPQTHGSDQKSETAGGTSARTQMASQRSSGPGSEDSDDA